jgi:drug/metabolite transporter (DMT)-like permease
MSNRIPARALPGAQKLAFAALLVGAVAVGASAIFFRLNELEPIPSAFYRPFLAIPAVWLWLRLRPAMGGRQRPETARELFRLLLAGAFFAGDLAFWHLSLDYTSVANATLFANAAPIFVVLGGWMVFGQRVTAMFLSGMAIATAGAACLAAGSFALSPQNLLGDGFGVLTAAFLASYLIAVERLRGEFTAAAIMLWTSIGTSAVLLPVALATGETMIATTAFGWIMLFGLGLVSHAAGQGLVVFALAHLPATLASVGLLLEPVAAALLAAIILGEAVTAWQFVGGAIILWGIFIARKAVT